MKIRIKQLPKRAYGGQQPSGALDVTPSFRSGSSYLGNAMLGKEVKKTLTKVPRKEANLEAEGGETAFGPISGDTIPDHMTITGPRHTNGGVPLKLPEDTFIFSDTKSMKIKDPKILKMFGKTKKKGGYTPAELAKPYDINKYKAILADPDSDRMDRENAELMIKNFIMKLGGLAIAQESKKGFPQGIPEMARPYMEANGISDEDLLPKTEEEQMPQEGQMPPQEEMEYGGSPKYPHGGFHDANMDFNERMKQTMNADINIGSAEKVMGASDAKAGIFSPDNPMTNQLTGKRQAFMTDPKTGDYVEVEQPEKSEDKEFSIEQKINDASQINLEEAANQGAVLSGVVRDIGLGLKAGQREASMRNNYFDQKDESKESVKRGINMANTPGVSYSSQPTTVQSYMSQYGGELDRFVYGGDEPINPAGTRDFTTHFNNASQPVMREQPTYSPATDPNMTKNYMTDRQGNITGQAYVPAGQTYNSRKLNRQFKRGKVQGESFYDGEYAYGGEPDEDYLQFPTRPYDEDTQRSMDENAEVVRQAFVKDNRVFKDIFLEKEDNRPISRPTMTYGGTPMSLYGMEMGGSYYPTMSTGGTRRVKITGLPKAHSGANVEGTHPQHHDLTYDEADERTQEDYDAATEADGWRTVTDAQGRKYKVLYKAGQEVAGTRREVEGFQGEVDDSNRGSYGMSDVCSWLNDENSKWYNASYASLTGGKNPVIADTPENQKMYAECAPKQEEGAEEVKEAIKVVDDPKDCGCPEVDADGNIVKNEDGSNKLIATGEQAVYNEETKKWECPPCDYEGGGGEKVVQEVDDPMWSDTATRNAVTQALYRTDAERMDPDLLDRPDFSPVLKRRYDQDLLGQMSGMRKNLESMGLTSQQMLAMNLSGLGKVGDAVGARQKDTEDYNKNVLNQAAQFDAGLDLKTYGANQNALNRARMLNLSQGDKETAAGNQKLANMNRAAIDADREVLDKATWNFKNPDFKIDYKTGLPYKDISEKTPNPTKSTDILTQYETNLKRLGEGNEAVAYKLARDQVYGKQTSKFGGSVKSSSFIPTYTTMPYGN